MSRLVTFATAVAAILVVSAATLFLGGSNVGAQDRLNGTPVVVVNDALSPVVVDDKPGRIPWRQWTIVHLDGTDYRSEPVVKMVRKGYRLHITDVNVNGCVQLLRDTLAVNLTVWPLGYMADPTTPPAVDEIPRNVILLSDRGVFRDMRHFGGSQQPNIFLEEGEALWAEAYRTFGKLHGEVAIWSFGYLEPVLEMSAGSVWEQP